MTPLEWLEEEGWTIGFSWIDKNTMGTCDFHKQHITISVQLLVVQTFLHEYYHAKLNTCSERVEKLAWKHVRRMSLQEIEETYIELVSHDR